MTTQDPSARKIQTMRIPKKEKAVGKVVFASHVFDVPSRHLHVRSIDTRAERCCHARVSSKRAAETNRESRRCADQLAAEHDGGVARIADVLRQHPVDRLLADCSFVVFDAQ